MDSSRLTSRRSQTSLNTGQTNTWSLWRRTANTTSWQDTTPRPEDHAQNHTEKTSKKQNICRLKRKRTSFGLNSSQGQRLDGTSLADGSLPRTGQIKEICMISRPLKLSLST
uniref:Uncharacterized protein n=1 Tax=Cacopsylla melanoneura TaxID=428564 RepID=A0A8D8VBQ1_9HEMI